MSPEAIFLAVAIFVMRVLNYSVGTVRLIAIARGQRIVAALLASVEAFIFAVVIANVVSDLENVINMVAYCGGAAAGSYLGMVLETRLIKGFVIANVISSTDGHEVAVALRDAGYGVTEIMGQGRDGNVLTLRSVVNKLEISKFNKIVQQINPKAFIALEEATGIQHGWFGNGRGGKRG